MRKLILGEFVSVDGFAADAEGTTSFFEDPKWAEGNDEDMLRQMEDIDTILLGANTYKMFLQYWPAADPEKEIIATRLNETPKVVFSSSLKSVEWGEWEAPRLVAGSAEDEVRKLKEQDGKDMILWGSISLAQSLLRAGLVDEIHLRTVPVLLGKGRLMFAEGGKLEMETKSVKRYASGLVLTEFAVSGKR